MGWSSIINKVPHPVRKRLLIPGPVNTKFKFVADMAPREKVSTEFIKEVRTNLKYTNFQTKHILLFCRSGTACNESVMRMFLKKLNMIFYQMVCMEIDLWKLLSTYL